MYTSEMKYSQPSLTRSAHNKMFHFELSIFRTKRNCFVQLYFTKNEYSKTYVKRPSSNRPKIGFQDQLSLNAGQKYCRMLQGEHSAILLTFIKLPFIIKIFVLSIFSGRFTQVLLCLLYFLVKIKVVCV